jgi:hypothetical protein
MFDLDHAIRDWRRQMAAEGIKSSETLDELEGHLRDEMDQQTRSGSSAQEAFEAAVQVIGQPASLKVEFEKIAATMKAREWVEHAVLVLAGIPHARLANNMNTPHTILEPRWATYLRAAAFLVPAVGLWMFSAVFVVPKLQQICLDAGLPGSGRFWSVTHSNIVTTLVFKEYGIVIFGGVMLVLFLLEWRSGQWPRYRRATVGVGTFLLNSFILVSIFMMFIAVMVAAPALAHHAR